jgi:hypothetical protein
LISYSIRQSLSQPRRAGLSSAPSRPTRGTPRSVANDALTSENGGNPE